MQDSQNLCLKATLIELYHGETECPSHSMTDVPRLSVPATCHLPLSNAAEKREG